MIPFLYWNETLTLTPSCDRTIERELFIVYYVSVLVDLVHILCVYMCNAAMANIRAALMALTSGNASAQGVASGVVLGSSVVLVSNLNEKVSISGVKCSVAINRQ